jgi:hypothetical protein
LVFFINDLKIPDSGKNKVDSFAKLYAYWQDVFSVSILNKKFYQELSNWYFWAVKEVVFPSEPTAADEHLKKIDLSALRQEHNAKNVIRLLTRFLFVWFVKEKKLIPEELFDIDYLKNKLLKDLGPVRDEGLFKEANIESVYYKAILQNLFFASLNCPIEPSGDGDNRKRAFRLKDNYGQHRDANYLMRYQGHFKNPEKFTELINGIVPFLNGGLFECLDNKTDKIYIDGFSDNLVKPHQLIVPDYLFFGFDQEVDLSGVVGISTKAFKNATVKGLISILESYKFTIAENTPIEEDVALDPELLGKVFENLLASYNPETKTTARKQTGSFYTPREIVNYMVDESLIAYLKNRLKNWDIEEEELDKQLHDLLSYDAVNPFAENNDLQKQIIHALDNCKILDPACGSGAFPMGMLQKMVHILQKVDPENKYWQELQLNKAVKETKGAFAITDKKEREQKLIEINEAFDEKINDPDYARKLFLVENCIYGVDIQEIAAQMSKLRFFISLVVDQKVDKTKPNFGIRALPNLKTKFVAANTLIGIEKPEVQMNLFDNQEIKERERELKNVRHRLFSAKSPATKRKLRDKDKEIREKIGDLLVEHGWGNETAKQLAGWDPYDQNASSPFFDPEWMFDISDGFDVVIGNPPYIGEKGNSTLFRNVANSSLGQRFSQMRMDMFYYFFHLSLDLCKDRGVGAFISTNYFITAAGAIKLRLDLKNRATMLKIINFNELKIFQSAIGQHNMISVFRKGKNQQVMAMTAVSRKIGVANNENLTSIITMSDSDTDYFSIKQDNLYDGGESYIRLTGAKSTKLGSINSVLDLLITNSYSLNKICEVDSGIQTGIDRITNKHIKKGLVARQYLGSGVFVLSESEVDRLALNKSERKILKKWHKNSDISPYYIDKQNEQYLLYITRDLTLTEFPSIYKHIRKFEKAIKNRSSNRGEIQAALAIGKWWVLFVAKRPSLFISPKIVCPQRSKINAFAYDNSEFYASKDIYYITPRSKNTNLKFILAILNSKLIYHWLYNKGKRKGEMLELYATPLENIPIKEVTKNQQLPFELIVGQMIFLKKNNEIIESQAFENVIDGLVFSIYFPDHMKERKIDILQFVEKDLKDVMQDREFDQLTDHQKEKVIDDLHARWTNPRSEIVKRMNSFTEKSPDILKPILES